MGIEFRQRSAGDFAKIINRRKWHILLPTIAVFAAFVWVVASLPDYFESKTSLTLKAPSISEKVAPSLTDQDLSDRLLSINQIVLSRSALEPVINKYDLFPEERASGMPTDLLVDRMKSAIVVERIKGPDEKVIGFDIKFTYKNPDIAWKVTADLAEMYVAEATNTSTENAENTREFIDAQLAQAKGNLDSIEKQRLAVMTKNVDTLPESAQGMIAQLQGLRQRESTIGKDKETLIIERGRIQESIRSLNSQMRLIEDYGEKETQDAVAQASRIEDTPAYGQLIQRRAELNSRLENLKKQYRDKHPDIIQAQTDIAKLNEELDKLAKGAALRVTQARQTGSRKAELQKKGLEIERQKAESQIVQIDQQLQSKDDETRQNAVQISAIEAKINTIPNVKVALDAVDNQYQTAKSNYDELLKKYNNAQQQVQRESSAQGPTIAVLDPANRPQKPVNAKKKPFLALLGAGIGLAFGLFLAAIFEIPRLFRIQTIDDAAHYTGLPVLASVPPLLTEGEIASRRRWHRLRVVVGNAAALASIPFLIAALQASRILERLS